MYLFSVLVKASSIEGGGVFADEDIKAGEIVWEFDVVNDCSMSTEDYDELDEINKQEIRKVGCVSPTSGKWIYPPVDDAARFTNRSETENNLTAMFDATVSQEPYFVANVDIAIGQELIVNYVEFDASIKGARPEWMNSY